MAMKADHLLFHAINQTSKRFGCELPTRTIFSRDAVEKGRQVQGPASAGSCSPWTTDVHVYMYVSVYVYARVPVAF